MKSSLLPLLLALIALPFLTASRLSAQASDALILREIAHVETGNNPNARVGSRGERTQYQFLPATWRRYSRLPIASARHNQAEVARVAHAHIRDIRARLKARGIPDSPYYIAVAWNAGANWKRIPPSTRSYAQRVHNLVEDALARHAQVQPPVPPPPPRVIAFSIDVPHENAPSVSFPLASQTATPTIRIREVGTHTPDVYFIPPLRATFAFITP